MWNMEEVSYFAVINEYQGLLRGHRMEKGLWPRLVRTSWLGRIKCKKELDQPVDEGASYARGQNEERKKLRELLFQEGRKSGAAMGG